MIRRGTPFVGAIVLACTAACASVLGVDSSDYIDAADLLCKCAAELDNCKTDVDAIAEQEREGVAKKEGGNAEDKDSPLEAAVLSCLGDVGADTCPPLYDCVAGKYKTAGAKCVRIPPTQTADGSETPGATIIACSGGRDCGDDQVCCVPDKATCTTGDTCCAGLDCIDGACATPPCGADSADCVADGACCSGSCGDAGTCAHRDDCHYPRSDCNTDDDCCIGKCSAAGVCVLGL